LRNVPLFVNTTVEWIVKALSWLRLLMLSVIAISARSITWLSLVAKKAVVALSATWHLSQKTEEPQQPKDYAPMPRLLTLKELAARVWGRNDR